MVDKYLTVATLDRIFIATKVAVKGMPDHPERDMCRFEFYESLVRIAATKFKDSGICSTYAESLKALIKQCILPNFKGYEWQGWRSKELWTMEINDILYANLDSLKRVYGHYFTPKTRWLTYQDAIAMVCRDSPVQLADKEAI